MARQLSAFLGGGMLALATGVSLCAQLATVPLRLELSTPAKEVTAGAPVVIRATLENMRNQATVALEDVPVTLIWPATAKRASLVIRKGQTSAQLPVTLSALGLTKMQATAPKLPPAFLLLIVKPPSASGGTPSDAPHEPPSARERGRAPAAVPPVTAPPPATPAPPEPAFGRAPMARRAPASPRAAPRSEPVTPMAAMAGPRLDLQVVPDQVDPVGRAWTAQVGVALVSSTGEPFAALNDVPIRLSARFGQVAPATATIHRGQIAVADDVTVAAQRPGTDTIAAMSPFGAVQKPVVFNAPQPAKLRVEVNPPDVVNDGRSEIIVTVMLLDGDNHPTPTPDRPLCATVSSSLGDLRERNVCIDQENFSRETALTSSRHGEARITARAIGLEDANTTARFLFPWLMLGLAIAGGILGSFLRSGKLWATHLGRNIALAAILGFIFYVLAFFGAIGAIRKLPFEIGKIAAINELGALALGFIGGYYGPLLLQFAPAKPGDGPRRRGH
jgi:hypothetical protein